YYESRGQVLAHHVNWMRSRGYGEAINYLPHDGVQPDKITGKRYEDHWRDAGFSVEPSVPNQGGEFQPPARICSPRLRLMAKLSSDDMSQQRKSIQLGTW